MSSHKRLKINIHTIDIEVSESVVLTMKSYRQFSGNELGGILLGSVINNNKIRINKISPPFYGRFINMFCDQRCRKIKCIHKTGV